MNMDQQKNRWSETTVSISEIVYLPSFHVKIETQQPHREQIMYFVLKLGAMRHDQDTEWSQSLL